MIKKGRFAKWNNREFELFFYQGKYYLRSNDIQDSALGFSPIEEGKEQLVRETAIRDLDEAYEIVPYVIYDGHRLQVEGFDTSSQTVVVTSNNPFVKDKLDMRPYGRYEFITEMPFSDIEIEEEKIFLFESILRAGE